MVQRISYSLRTISKQFVTTFSTLFIRQRRRETDNLSSFPNYSSIKIPQDSLHQLANKFDGKLLLRNEIPIAPSKFNNLLKYHLFTSQSSIKKSCFQIRCIRCNNNKHSLFGMFPCAKCHNTHLYCRKCIMMGRVSECEMLYSWSGPRFRWPKHRAACTWDGELTFFQRHASKRVVQAIETKTELLVWAVAGAGKTEILFRGIELALQKGERICIATPRADVVRELVPRIKQAFQSIEVQALYGKSKEKEATAQLIISTTHQLLRFSDAFDVMIIDEIDAFPYHNDQSLQFATKRAVKQVSSIIYLTATPRDKLKRKVKFNKLPYCFIPVRYHGYPLPIPHLIADFSLQKQLKNKNLPKSFLRWLDERENRKRQILIFVPTIQLANELTEPVTEILLQKKLIYKRTEVVSVYAEDEEREEKILSFRNKNIYLLITTTILERGVTFPSVDVVVLRANHKVFDEAALVQIAGRAGRAKDDPTGEVLFIHDGKTESMIDAVYAIKQMNRRGQKLSDELRSEKLDE